MRETYWKSGSSVRLEFAAGRESLLEIDERGVAATDGPLFSAAPSIEIDPVSPAGENGVLEVWGAIQRSVRVEVERAVIAEGRARHRHSFGGRIRDWEDAGIRTFLSFVNPVARARVQLHLGARSAAELDLADLHQAAGALAELRPGRGEPRGTKLLLAPPVSAELWPMLAHVTGPVSIGQSTHPQLRHDGRGEVIETAPGGGRRRWPNVFRPSYRIPPAAAPFHLSAGAFGEMEPVDAVAVALTAPFVFNGESLEGRFLCRAGEVVYEQPLGFPAAEWMRRIAAIGVPVRWYPVGAGSWGSEVVLEI